MPEITEIEFLSEKISLLKNYKVLSVILPKRIENISYLENSFILKSYCKGKKLIIDFTNCKLVISLGLTGKIFIKEKSPTEELDSLTSTFGWIELFLEETKYVQIIKGSIIFSVRIFLPQEKKLFEDFTGYVENITNIKNEGSYQRWLKKTNIKKRKISLCSFLIEQKHYVGIGNRLKSEICYLSLLNPDKSCKDLSDEEILKLFRCIKFILKVEKEKLEDLDDPSIDIFKFCKNSCFVYRRKIDDYGNKVMKIKTKDSKTTYVVLNQLIN